MYKKNIIAALFVSVSVSFGAFELGNQYIGVDYHSGIFDLAETGVDTANPKGMSLKYGRYIAKNIAIEFRYLNGTSDDQITYYWVDYDFGLDYMTSLYIKGDLDIIENLNAFGVVGYTQGKVTLKSEPYFSDSSTDSGLSYGVGAEYSINDTTSFTLEYIIYVTTDTYDYSGVNLGMKYYF